jgi:hypothetical protein
MNDRRDQLDADVRLAVTLTGGLADVPGPRPGDPDDETLLRLVDGNLPRDERRRLERLVDASPHARDRLLALREALAEAGERVPARPDLDPLAAAGRVARIAFGWAEERLSFLWGTLEPRQLVAAPVPTRGQATRPTEETAFFDFSHRFEGVDVVIQVERLPSDRLDVQLLFESADVDLSRLRVTLSDDHGGLLDSQPVEQGRTRFASLAPRGHQLRISAAQQELGRVLLDVRSL